MKKISVIILTKNEDERIERALQSAQWADEIIVFDSGSTDSTLDIAKRYKAKIFANIKWKGFGAQRNLAIKKAKNDFIFMLDADEEITTELKNEIKNILKDDTGYIVYSIPRKTHIFNKTLNYCWYPDYCTRIFSKQDCEYSEDLVHEKLILKPGVKIQKLTNHLIHYQCKDLNHFLDKCQDYANYWAEQKYSQNKKVTLFSAYIHSVFCFLKNYFLKKGFLDGAPGFLACKIGAYSTFIKYSVLWEKQSSK